MTKYLVEHYIHLSTDSINDFLLGSIDSGCLELVKYFIEEYTADIKIIDEDELEYMIEYNYIEMIEYLVGIGLVIKT
jgi:hypothetical protein